MTRNQIEYWKLFEQRRNNLVVEAETERSHKANEQHNENVLNYNYQVLAETKRANQAREALQLQQFRQQIYEFATNTALQRRELDERIRSNRANEKIQAQRTLETERSNKANEAIKAVQNTLALQDLNERVRSNKAQEQLKSSQQQLDYWKNQQTYKLGTLNYQESKRANLARESQARQVLTLNYAQLSEQRRHSIATEIETAKSHRNTELINLSGQGLKATTDVLSTGGRTIGNLVTTGGK